MIQQQAIKEFRGISQKLANSEISRDDAKKLIRDLFKATGEGTARSCLFSDKALKSTPRHKLGRGHLNRMKPLCEEVYPDFFNGVYWADFVK